MSDPRRLTRLALCGSLALLLVGCSYLGLGSAEKIAEPPGLIAVLPFERDSAVPPGSDSVEADAERVLTAQVYAVLAASSVWRYVPDVTTGAALKKIAKTGPIQEQARELGRAAGADSVLVGTVTRYRQRIGTEYGVQRPASVAFTLSLVSVASGDVTWSGNFSETQEPLTSNLLNVWQFWEAGPKWFTVEEFSRMAVERVMADLARRL